MQDYKGACGVWVKNLDFCLKVEIHCVVSVEKVSELYIHNLSR
jgi:hypothetical protein